MEYETTDFSLLYPAGAPRGRADNPWGKNTVDDLEIDQIAWHLSLDNKYQDGIKKILLELCADGDTLTYRQEILADFLDQPGLAQTLRNELPALAKLKYYADTRAQKSPLSETLNRLSELHMYIKSVRRLQDSLSEASSQVRSRGLAGLRQCLDDVAADPTFLSLEKNLPSLLAKMTSVPSISIGVNLDSELMPVEATLLSIHDKPFKGSTLFDQLLGRAGRHKPQQGLGPMHEVPHKQLSGLDSRIVKLEARYDPLLVPLFRDLFEIMRSVLAPVSAELKEYAQVNARLLIQLESEIAFYVGAAAFIQKVQAAGLPMSRPVAVPLTDRLCRLEGLYNPILALSKMEGDAASLKGSIVLNDVEFGPAGRIFILTGPNQGGKTVYTQAVGLAQVFFQAGLFVPAASAHISPVDGIYTHFATRETTESGMGRLAEEAQRLNEIFHSITEQSLVLLNESLSSTSPGESLYIARDVVCALRLFGVRAIFATHLHELAENLEAMNKDVQGDSTVVSLVAGVDLEAQPAGPVDDLVQRTYKIKPGPPRGLSYSRGIAVQYGISYEQLTERFQEHKKSESQ